MGGPRLFLRSLLLLLSARAAQQACGAPELAACQTSDMLHCAKPCECMVKYGVCMRSAGCPFEMYENYLNACIDESDGDAEAGRDSARGGDSDDTADTTPARVAVPPTCPSGSDCATAAAGSVAAGIECMDVAQPVNASALAARVEVPVILAPQFVRGGALHRPVIMANSSETALDAVRRAFASHDMLKGVSAARLEAVARELEAERKKAQRSRQSAGGSAGTASPPAERPPLLPASPALLAALAHAHSASYQAAAPFPHAVFDTVFDSRFLGDLADECEARVPQITADDANPHFHDPWTNRKWGLERYETMGSQLQRLISFMKAGVFVSFLEQLTGISGLLPDPHNDGGGLHVTRRGGHLKVHTDFHSHYRLRLERRVNVFVYLNRNWSTSWGGDLQLWQHDMRTCHRSIPPLFNRLVVFSSSDRSNHGHPDPLAAPRDRVRMSVALYYYTVGRPKSERSSEHSTAFYARPGRDEQDQVFYP